MNLFERAGMAALNLAVKLAGGQKLPRSSQAPVFTSPSQDGRPIFSTWDADRAVDQGLKVNAWVYSAVAKVAGAVASVPLVLEKRVGKDWQPDPGHDIQRLLNRPNPFMGRQDLSERWTQFMLLSGNALVWLNIVRGKPAELWPIHPDTIKPLASRANFIGGYEWKVDTSTKRLLDVAEVAHWMFPDPSDPRWGLAPLKAGAGAVDMDQAAARWNRAVLANDGKPPLAVILESSLPIQQARDAAALVREQIDGGSIRQALVLGGTSKVQPLSLNATDLDFLNGRKFSREEIAAVFGVPPVLLSFGEAATFANLDAAKTALWEDRVVPLLDDLCQGYMGALFPYWGLTEDAYRIKADLSGVRALQSNLKTEAETGKLKAEMFKALADAGVPANMAAVAAGLPLADIPGGDQPRQQAYPVTPLSGKARRLPGMERKDKGSEAEDIAPRLARMDEWTDQIRGKVAELLLSQGNAAAAAYAAGEPWEPELSLEDWRTLLEAIHTAVIEAEGAVAYAAVLGTITAVGGAGTFDVLADGVVEWIDQHVGDMVKGITDTSKAVLRAEITAGVEAGESVRDIAKRLRGVGENWSDTRAMLIARTEVASAFNAAHQLSAEQIVSEFDVQMVKTWRSAGDSRVRPDHREMDGETVPIDQRFSNGLMQPGEPNCRCVVTYMAK